MNAQINTRYVFFLGMTAALAGLLFGFSTLLAAGASQGEDPAGNVRNDMIFPPAPAAREAITFDGKGFVIQGKRTFLSSGAIHYSRVPRALWEDRFLRMVQANFNCVETVVFWNLHEPQENAWDFSDEKDIGAFFDLAKSHGLYAIARVGPYVCAEWEFGGYPIWMKFKPGVVVRTENPKWLALSDRWYEKIIPLVAQRQIHKGGNIILVQLENEHPLGWGRVETPYFKHLADTAIGLGLEVPYFMSGLHHGPSPQPANGDTSKRENPWFSTEFWAGWFDLYGPISGKKLRTLENTQWMIMARGGGGQNFYLIHGGSNLDNRNDPSGAASYDYGCAIGQAGDLRPVYYRMKRANQLAQSFPEILANGSDASAAFSDFVSGGTISGARRSPAGTLVFISNPSGNEAKVRFKNGDQLTARPYENFAIPVDVEVADGVKIAESTLRVLGLARNGSTTTLVVHGKPGESGHLILAGEGPLHQSMNATADKTAPTHKAITCKQEDPHRIALQVSIPEKNVAECILETAKGTVRVLALSSDLSCYTWLLGQPGRQFVVCGPAFVRDLKVENGQCSLLIERPYGVASCGHVAVFGAKEEAYHLEAKSDPSVENQPAPVLSNWQMASFKETEPGFDDSSWMKSEDPLPMGADGDTSAFAWYRVTIDSPAAGTATLKIAGKDSLLVWLNGQPVSDGSLALRPGKNILAVFVSHAGRNKALHMMKDLSELDQKGITGKVTLERQGQSQEIKGWRMRGGIHPLEANRVWRPVGNISGGPVLFKAAFNAKRPGNLGAYPIYRADFSKLTRGTMWLNGHCLGRYPERIRVCGIYLPECWFQNGANELMVLDEAGANATEMKLVVESAASRESIQVSAPVDPARPILVPQENPPKDLPALNKDNLAFKAIVSASSEKKDQPASAATDGDTDSTWSAAKNKDGAWLSVDLGHSQILQTCEIIWDSPARRFKYTLEASDDGEKWRKIGDQKTAVPTSTDSPSELCRIQFSPISARFLRVTTPAPQPRTKAPWPAISEFRALGK